MSSYTDVTLAIYTRDEEKVVKKINEGLEIPMEINRQHYGNYTVLYFTPCNYYCNCWQEFHSLIDDLPHNEVRVEKDGTMDQDYESYDNETDTDDPMFESILNPSVEVEVDCAVNSPRFNKCKVDAYTETLWQILKETQDDNGKLTSDEFNTMILYIEQRFAAEKKEDPGISADDMKQELYTLYCNKMSEDGERADSFEDFLKGRYMNEDSMCYLIESLDMEGRSFGQDKKAYPWLLWLAYCNDREIDPE